jgi:hypothetical protein
MMQTGRARVDRLLDAENADARGPKRRPRASIEVERLTRSGETAPA